MSENATIAESAAIMHDTTSDEPTGAVSMTTVLTGNSTLTSENLPGATAEADDISLHDIRDTVIKDDAVSEDITDNADPSNSVGSVSPKSLQMADENDVTTTSPMSDDGILEGFDRGLLPMTVFERTSGEKVKTECKVCGDEASGMYFGALVCVPCKTFFLRYAGEGKKFACKYWRNCDVTVTTRTQCKCCRYQKCLQAGMRRRVRPAQVQVGEGQQLCAVCSDVGNGIHFGVITCEGCKKFFRRGLIENASYRCKNGGQCLINPQTRNLCRYCRYQKCLATGMSRNAIQMGRPTKYSHAGGGNGEGGSSGANAKQQGNGERGMQPSASLLDQSQFVNGHINSWHQNPFAAIMRPKLFPSVSVIADKLMPGHLGLNRTNCDERGSMRVASSPGHPVLPDSTVVETEHCDRENFNNGVLPPDRRPVKRPSADEAIDLSNPKVLPRLPSDGINGLSDSQRLAQAAACLQQPMLWSWLSMLRPFPVESPFCAAKRKDPPSAIDLGGLKPAVNDNMVVVSKPKDVDNAEMSVDDETVSACSPKTNSGYVLPTDAATKMETDLTEASEQEEFSIDQLMSTIWNYWLLSSQHTSGDVVVANHWVIINQIVPAYDKFVNYGTCLNRLLREEFEEWSTGIAPSDVADHLPNWIKYKVIPAYTIASATYCKSLPGFEDFDSHDQATIIRLGQSSSRILLAAIHWYDAEQKTFKNFLSWRLTSSGQPTGMDLYKKRVLDYSESINVLDIDPVEAALLNALLIIATDYPNLKNPTIIQQARSQILASLQAYMTAKYGGANTRIKALFSCVPEARRLGLLHYQMTKTRTMSAEEVEASLNPSTSVAPS